MTYFISFTIGLIIMMVAASFWVLSASEIAKECDKLGSFYVGDKVYKCEIKK